MNPIRDALSSLSHDSFWDEAQGVTWRLEETGRGTGLVVHNPSVHEIAVVAGVLHEAASPGNHGGWIPAQRLGLTARKGPSILLPHPVLRPGVQQPIRPGQEQTLDLPGTIGSGAVRSLVLTSTLEGRAVKYWELDGQGVPTVLRDDVIRFHPADLLTGLFGVVGIGR